MKKYIAEFLGTFILASIVLLSITNSFIASTPVLAAITVAVLVYLFIHVSGAHLNPAVTIAALSADKIRFQEAVGYIVVQILGASIALKLIQQIAAVPTLYVSNTAQIGVFEAIGAFILMISIASIAYGKNPLSLSGVVIGGGLFIGIALASLGGSLGILNPAIALSLHAGNLMYILGPIVGAVLGIHFYRKLIA